MQSLISQIILPNEHCHLPREMVFANARHGALFTNTSLCATASKEQTKQDRHPVVPFVCLTPCLANYTPMQYIAC